MAATQRVIPNVEEARECILGLFRRRRKKIPMGFQQHILHEMPKDWRLGRSRNEVYPESLAGTAINALNELIEERKVKLVAGKYPEDNWQPMFDLVKPPKGK